MRRPRAEACDRLALADVRGLVEPGAETAALPDGTTLALRWGEARGCYGGRPGCALLLVCPICSRSARVLWRPPGRGWGCCRCWPLSHPSHRRPGARKGRPKPLRWRGQQINREQRRCADLLGLESWPPERLLWSGRDLWRAPRRPDAPRISHHRQLALIRRLDALESLRVLAIIPNVDAFMKPQGLALQPPPAGMGPRATETVHATGWAVRRGPRDPRSSRGGPAAEID
jgi:hypothetical protein